MKKNILSIVLAIVLTLSVFTSTSVSVSAASEYQVNVSTGSYVEIKNVGSGKYLNVYGSRSKSNTNITVYERDYTTGQKFMIEGSGGKYTFKPKCATSCRLNVYGYSATQGSNVNIWTKSGNPTQAWVIKYIPDYKAYTICSADNTNYVVTATGSSNSSNVRLEKYKAGNKYQLWTCSAFSVKEIKTQTPQTSSQKANISAILASAEANVGKTGSQLGYNTAWCAYYVSDILRSNGVSISRAANPRDLVKTVLQNNLGTYYSFRPQNVANLKANGYNTSAGIVETSRSNFTPQPGDIVIYLWSADVGSYNWSHTGFVKSYSNGTLETIEGNTSRGVCASRTRTYGSDEVVGILRLK